MALPLPAKCGRRLPTSAPMLYITRPDGSKKTSPAWSRSPNVPARRRGMARAALACRVNFKVWTPRHHRADSKSRSSRRRIREPSTSRHSMRTGAYAVKELFPERSDDRTGDRERLLLRLRLKRPSAGALAHREAHGRASKTDRPLRASLDARRAVEFFKSSRALQG